MSADFWLAVVINAGLLLCGIGGLWVKLEHRLTRLETHLELLVRAPRPARKTDRPLD